MNEPSNQRTIEPGYSYRNLALWQGAQAFAEAVIRIVDQLPSRRSTDTIGRQLTRSATSIAANVAEGHGRFGYASYKNHLSIAKGSACEADSWLDLLRRLALITPEQEAELHAQCVRLIAALTKRIRELESAASKSVREEPEPYDALADPSSPSSSMVQGFQGSRP